MNVMKGLAAGEALTALQYRVVYLSAANTVKKATAKDGSQKLIGVVQNAPASGAMAVIPKIGEEGLVEVDGNATAITVGLELTSDGAGKGIACDADKEHVIGIALEASTADGDIIRYEAANYTLST